MKPSSDSEYILVKHAARESGLPYQSLKDAGARRELSVLKLGREHGRREHWYFVRAEFEEWKRRKTIPKKNAEQIHAA